MPDANSPAAVPPAPTFIPGPWWADRRSILAGYGASLRCLAEVFSGAADSLEQADANCRLIAAAPDLLAALRELLAANEAMLDADEQFSLEACQQHDRAEAVAIAAIAKAEGRP